MEQEPRGPKSLAAENNTLLFFKEHRMNLFAFAETATTVVETVSDGATSTFDHSKQAVMDSFQKAYDQIIGVAPQILAMVVVIVLGYVVARFVGKTITALSEKL